MKKTNTLKDLNVAELMKKLAEAREEMRALRFNAAGARSKDPSITGKLRKDIARIMTELTAKGA